MLADADQRVDAIRRRTLGEVVRIPEFDEGVAGLDEFVEEVVVFCC